MLTVANISWKNNGVDINAI